MKSSIATAYICILFGPFGVFCLVWALIFVGRADYLSAVVALGSAAFSLGMVAMLAIVASRKVTPRLLRDEGGIVMRPDRRVDGLLMASTFGGFSAMALYAIFAPLGMLNIPIPRGNGQYVVFVCAAGVLVGVFGLRQLVKQGGMSYLRMDERGLVTGNTMTTVERTWDEVTDVADRPPKSRRSNGATYITTSDGRTRELPSNWYSPGGSALFEFVRFYWQHPEAREEFTDDRAVRRLDAASRGTA